MPIASLTLFDLSVDIATLIAEQVLGDCQSLSNLSLVNKAWRSICLRYLLHTVDLSCHNLGHQPQWDSENLIGFDYIEADYADRFRPQDKLVPRQRAFLRLMAERPDLTGLVENFTWTLIWVDFQEYDTTEIDRQTWKVFGQLTNVTRLDLASLHEIGDEPYIRQNPERLFQAVTELRLVGWMHRGLVSAIVNSLDASKLRRIELHHLQDEGALPGGKPMFTDFIDECCRDMDKLNEETVLDDDVIDRQTAGEAFIFPGPMWLPLRSLRMQTLSSLASMHIRLGPFGGEVDRRSLFTMHSEIAKFIVSAKASLESLTIAQGESIWLHCDDSMFKHTCGTSRIGIQMRYRPWVFDMTTAFLQTLLKALNSHTYPRLKTVKLPGFRVVETGSSRRGPRPPPDTELTWSLLGACPFVDIESIRVANVDRRRAFTGYELALTQEDEGGLADILARS